jgi:hypothetical protein
MSCKKDPSDFSVGTSKEFIFKLSFKKGGRGTGKEG